MADEGPGFPFFLPNGMIVYNTLMDYWREIHKRDGYVEISTPIILNRQLWEQSGHWDHYKENMYFTKIDEGDYAVKPMNCPGGMLVYRMEPHSYRDLPMRVGEIGLDYFYDFSPRERQIEVFRQQIELANKLDLPVIIHDREAHEDTMNLLKKHKPMGVVHCFSGSVEMAKEIVKKGFYIAFGGTVTFKNARKVVEAAREVPLDRLLIETDCPYLAPHPHRGKMNHSGLMRYTAEKLAARTRFGVNDNLFAF